MEKCVLPKRTQYKWSAMTLFRGITNPGVVLPPAFPKGVCMCIVLAVCTCLHADNPPSSNLSSSAVTALIQELHEAEAHLEDLVKEAEEENPELKTYKARKEAVNHWYWNDRMKSWNEMASDLYGTDASQKDYRQRVFERAKHFAFMLSLCEAARTGENDWIFDSLFPTEEARTDFAEEHGISISDSTDSEQFLKQVKDFYRKNSAACEAKTLEWRNKHSFITPAVWKQADMDAMAEFEIDVLEREINELTPPEVREAEKRVNQMRQELTRIAPHYEELRRFGRESQSSNDPGLDEEGLRLLQDHAQEPTPAVPGDGHSNGSTTETPPPGGIVHDETTTDSSPAKQGISSPPGNNPRLGMPWSLLCIVAGLAVVSLVGMYAWIRNRPKVASTE